MKTVKKENKTAKMKSAAEKTKNPKADMALTSRKETKTGGK